MKIVKVKKTKITTSNRTLKSAISFILLILAHCQTVSSVEFTFELPDNSEDCFHENIKPNTSAYLEFQVSAGGQLDVDVTLKDPNGRVLFEQKRATFGSHQFTAELSGVYTACFGNQFSSFSHKFVYVDFQVGEELALPGIDEHAARLTQMETSSQAIHKSLNDILDAQTHHRLREAQGRKRADELNDRVMRWSSVETIVVFLIGFAQVMILRNFFSDPKPNRANYQPIKQNY